MLSPGSSGLSSFSTSLLSHLSDEYPKTSVLTFDLLRSLGSGLVEDGEGIGKEREGRKRLVIEAMSLWEMMELSGSIVPIQPLDSLSKASWNEGIEVDVSLSELTQIKRGETDQNHNSSRPCTIHPPFMRPT